MDITMTISPDGSSSCAAICTLCGRASCVSSSYRLPLGRRPCASCSTRAPRELLHALIKRLPTASENCAFLPSVCDPQLEKFLARNSFSMLRHTCPSAACGSSRNPRRRGPGRARGTPPRRRSSCGAWQLRAADPSCLRSSKSACASAQTDYARSRRTARPLSGEHHPNAVRPPSSPTGTGTSRHRRDVTSPRRNTRESRSAPRRS